MCRPISISNVNQIQELERISSLKQNSFSKIQEEMSFLFGKKDKQVSIIGMANAINAAAGKEILPTYKEIFKKFAKGELDPRKNGEFTCKVQGRDNSIHIYIGKNKRGEDCVCLDYRKKHEECNIYSTLHIKMPFSKYDEMVKKAQKK